jgi:hypothetical protein
MARITDLDALLFPVAQEKLYSLRADSEDELRPVEHHSAIVRRDTGKVLGVVGRYYQLVTHGEAVDMGRRCMRELLGLDVGVQPEIFQVDAFSDGSLCYVDLVHPAYRMNLLGNGWPSEIYVPYVRVTNSYNGLRSPSFDVGFCRTLCSNGVIFERETVNVSYVHKRHHLRPKDVEFSLKAGQFTALAERFRTFVTGMAQAPANDEQAEIALASVLRIPTRAWIVQRTDRFEKARLHALRDFAWSTLHRYRGELGPNHYALFNTMTELARTLPGRPGMWRERNTLERAVGTWATAFYQRARNETARRQAG